MAETSHSASSTPGLVVNSTNDRQVLGNQGQGESRQPPLRNIEPSMAQNRPLPSTIAEADAVAPNSSTSSEPKNPLINPFQGLNPADPATTSGSTTSGSRHIRVPSFTFTSGSSKRTSATIIDAAALNIPPNDFTFKVMYNASPLPSPRLTPAGVREEEVGNMKLSESIATLSLSPVTNGAAQMENEYSVLDEKQPALPDYWLASHMALRRGIEIATTINGRMQDRPDIIAADETFKTFSSEAKSLASYQRPSTYTIAILGDSGHGKSSLINSLLHLPSIANANANGSACTSVITEFRQKQQGQTTNIHVEIETYSKESIRDYVKELFWSYQKVLVGDVDAVTATTQEMTALRNESALAWSALATAFSHHAMFSREWLDKSSLADREAIETQLVAWADELEWPADWRDGCLHLDVGTAQEFRKETELFSKDRYWPFTKIIRVYVNAHILKSGIILADLPGLQDTNLARVRSTQDYLLKADKILIVSNIARAITNQSLQSSVYTVLAQQVELDWQKNAAKKSLNFAVVCTRADEINEDEARSDFCGDGKPLSLEALSKIDNDIKKAKAAEDKKLKKQLKWKRTLMLIKARNDHVKQGLQAAYAEKTKGKVLDVFFVSNSLYEKHVKKNNVEIVMASGVPEVRSYCVGLTAQRHLHDARDFLAFRLSKMVNSLLLWADKTQDVEAHQQDLKNLQAERIRKETQPTLDRLSIHAVESVAKFRQTFQNTFKEYILKSFKTFSSTWTTQAVKDSEPWEKLDWIYFRILCAHNGKLVSAALSGSWDWNRTLAWRMQQDLELQWQIFEEDTPSAATAAFTMLSEEINKLKAHLQDTQKTLCENIDRNIQQLKTETERIGEDLALSIRLIHRRASEVNETSFLASRMIPVYREALKDCDYDTRTHEKAVVRNYIKSGKLYADIAASITSDANTNAALAEIKLLNKMNQTVLQIKSDARLCLWDTLVDNKTVEAKKKLLSFQDEFQNDVEAWKDQVATLVKSVEVHTQP